MNVVQKLAYAKRAIESISRHDDESLDVRSALLEELRDFISEEREDAHARNRARLAEMKAAEILRAADTGNPQ